MVRGGELERREGFSIANWKTSSKLKVESERFRRGYLGRSEEACTMAPVMKPKVVISQDGFDGAVKENMEDFDMSLAEAVEDAIKTFQMQGANLSGQDRWMDGWMRSVFVHCVYFLWRF